jgi:outer membrane protein OmpA-like peptidoglycan-associated protein
LKSILHIANRGLRTSEPMPMGRASAVIVLTALLCACSSGSSWRSSSAMGPDGRARVSRSSQDVAQPAATSSPSSTRGASTAAAAAPPAAADGMGSDSTSVSGSDAQQDATSGAGDQLGTGTQQDEATDVRAYTEPEPSTASEAAADASDGTAGSDAMGAGGETQAAGAGSDTQAAGAEGDTQAAGAEGDTQGAGAEGDTQGADAGSSATAADGATGDGRSGADASAATGAGAGGAAADSSDAAAGAGAAGADPAQADGAGATASGVDAASGSANASGAGGDSAAGASSASGADTGADGQNASAEASTGAGGADAATMSPGEQDAGTGLDNAAASAAAEPLPGAGAGIGDANAGAGDAAAAAEQHDIVGMVEAPGEKASSQEMVMPQTLGGMLPLTIGVDGEGEFDFDRAVLRDDVKTLLDQLARKLQEAEFDTLEIVGHTDRIGTEEYNQYLSERRAWAVARYLVKQGVPVTKLRVVGKGMYQPLTDTDECVGLDRQQLIACVQKDRRVEISASIRRTDVDIR